MEAGESLFNFASRNLSYELYVKANPEVTKAMKSLAATFNMGDVVNQFKSRKFFEPEALFLYLCHAQNVDVDIELENTAELLPLN